METNEPGSAHALVVLGKRVATVESIRAAIGRAVRTKSLRTVATEAGMTHGGLARVLAGILLTRLASDRRDDLIATSAELLYSSYESTGIRPPRWLIDLVEQVHGSQGAE